MSKVDLSQYTNRDDRPEGYRYGRSKLTRLLWHFTSVVIFQSQLFPVNGLKVYLLRLFGAQVGEHVLIKPGVTIKYPWYLVLGDYVWIGEGVWLDCTGEITIGSNVVISQGACLCCGSHDWNDPGMGGLTSPIVVEDGVWICAFARVALGTTIGEDAVVLMGAIVLKDCEPSGIYQGHPAVRVGRRQIRDYSGPKREPGVLDSAMTIAQS